ncbi:MAG: ECF-type sigma factor [Planctomycetota bacterium]
MDSESTGSVSHWIEGLRAGDSAACQELWDRYFSRLVKIADDRLHRMSQEADGEDVALSALKSVMVGLGEGRFPHLSDRENLWPLLVTLTARKSIDQVRRQQADRRAASRTVSLDELRAALGDEPSPEFAAEFADELERLVLKFDEPVLRLIAQRKLEGFTNEEIAQEASCSKRSVIRKLNRIRQEWEEDEPVSDEQAP